MRKKYRYIGTLIISASLALQLCACGAGNTETENETTISLQQGESSIENSDTSIMTDVSVEFKEADDVAVSVDYSEENIIRFSNDSITYEGSGATVSENIITITSEGRYILTGSIDNGRVIVDATDDAKVELVFAEVSITCDNNSPVVVKNADKVRIILADDTENYVCDGPEYELDENDDITPKSAIYSKCDLVITGNGTLYVDGKYNNGIASTDDLIITNGTICVEAVNNGLKGKDSVRIKDGNITITSDDDGIKSDNDEDSEKGYVYIENGNIKIAATGDGINADKLIKIENGKIEITESDEGIEAQNIIINDGDISIYSNDDGINVSLSDYVSNMMGTNNTNNINNTNTDSDKMPEDFQNMRDNNFNGGQWQERPDKGGEQNGDMDSQRPEMPSGENGNMTEMPSGENGNESEMIGRGGNKQNGMGGFETVDGVLTINGGTIYVNAKGDGIDSNGSVVQTGGIVIVEGPSDNGNGALDYNGSYTMTGGTLLAIGSSGMAMAPSSSSTVYGTSVNTNVNAGDIINVLDGNDEIIKFEATKRISNIVVFSDKFSEGKEYTLNMNGNEIEFTAGVVNSNGMGH